MTSQTNQIVPQNNNLIESLTGGFIDPDLVVSTWEVEKGSKIADLGCGSGYFSIPIAKVVGEAGKVFAVDVREASLESVRSRAFLEKLNNVEAVRANLEKKNSLKKWIKNGECDAVLLVNILYTSKKKNAIVDEAKRILGSKGRIIVIEWAKKYHGSIIKNFGPPNELRLDEVEIQKLIGKSGYKYIESFPAGQYHTGMIFEKLR